MTYNEAVKRLEEYYIELQSESNANIEDKISWALYFTMRDAQTDYLTKKKRIERLRDLGRDI